MSYKFSKEFKHENIYNCKGLDNEREDSIEY